MPSFDACKYTPDSPGDYTGAEWDQLLAGSGLFGGKYRNLETLFPAPGKIGTAFQLDQFEAFSTALRRLRLPAGDSDSFIVDEAGLLLLSALLGHPALAVCLLCEEAAAGISVAVDLSLDHLEHNAHPDSPDPPDSRDLPLLMLLEINEKPDAISDCSIVVGTVARSLKLYRRLCKDRREAAWAQAQRHLSGGLAPDRRLRDLLSIIRSFWVADLAAGCLEAYLRALVHVYCELP